MLATMALLQMAEELLVTASQSWRYACFYITGLARVNCHVILFTILSFVCARSATISHSAAIKEAEDKSIGVLGEMVDDNVLKSVDFTLCKYGSLILHNTAVADVVNKAEDVNVLFSKCDYLLLEVCKEFVQGIGIFILQDDNIRLSPSEVLDALLDTGKSQFCRVT